MSRRVSYGWAVLKGTRKRLIGFISGLVVFVLTTLGWALNQVSLPVALAIVGVVVLPALFEASFQEWNTADTARAEAERTLAGRDSREGLPDRLREYRREIKVMRDSAPGRHKASLFSVASDVERQLRLYAPDHVGYWQENPSPGVNVLGVEALEFAIAQLDHIIGELESGSRA